jgi:photosystem II stability/assembly factor-like uncharacterized protein
MRYTYVFLTLLLFVFLGAGCFGGSDTSAIDGGVFQTADGGGEWTQSAAVLLPTGLGTLVGADVETIEMDPSDTQALYIGTRENGMLYSYDGGVSWMRPFHDDLTSGTINAIDVDPDNTCSVYVAKGGSLYHTQDCSRHFQTGLYVETRNGVEITQIIADWYNKDTIWLGLNNGDILRSQDAGNSWKTMTNTDRPVTDMMISNADSRFVLAGTDRDGMYRTEDGGETWVHIEKELKEFSNAYRVYRLTQTSTADVVIAATKYGLIRSFDFGLTWEAVDLVTAPGEVGIYGLAINPSDANVIYYTSGSTFYVTGNAGDTWSTSELATSREVQTLVVDPTNVSVLYIGVARIED